MRLRVFVEIALAVIVAEDLSPAVPEYKEPVVVVAAAAVGSGGAGGGGVAVAGERNTGGKNSDPLSE